MCQLAKTSYSKSPSVLLILTAIIPLTSFIEKDINPELQSVTTSIIIDANAEKVWKNVVEFPELDKPTEFIFKTGIAYPINAKIDGKGVGTVRHCNFTTGSNGSYAFANLPAGTYAITQTQPALFADGRDTAGTSGGSVSATNGSSAGQNTISTITLSAGAQATGNNFGELGASVSGAVYGDIDNSGTRNVGDSLINGTIITLSGLTSAGTDVCAFLTAQVPSRSCTITTGAGLFSFVGLPSGTYTLTQTQPAGYADGAETAGPAGGTPSDNRIAGIVLATGASAPASAGPSHPHPSCGRSRQSWWECVHNHSAPTAAPPR